MSLSFFKNWFATFKVMRQAKLLAARANGNVAHLMVIHGIGEVYLTDEGTYTNRIYFVVNNADTVNFDIRFSHFDDEGEATVNAEYWLNFLYGVMRPFLKLVNVNIRFTMTIRGPSVNCYLPDIQS